MPQKNYHVIHRPDGSWAVQAAGGKRATSVHQTQEEAIQSAKALVHSHRAEMTVHSPDGRFVDSARYMQSAPHSQSIKVEPGARAPEVTSLVAPIALQIGERIRRARIMRGYALRGLAEAMGDVVSHTMLQKFEVGESTPDSKLLGLIAKTLEVQPDYFFKSNILKLVAVEYRKLKKLGTKIQQKLEEEAFEFFERYLEIERILEIDPHFFPREDLSATAEDDLPTVLEEAAEKLRARWELGMNPIPNVHSTLEKYGVKVRLLPHQEGFDGFSAFAEACKVKIPVIGVSDECVKNRRDIPRFRFTALHELAHLFLVFSPTLSEKSVERACHHFAGAFLIPKAAFEETFGQNRVRIALGELCAIKSEWGISIAATMKRALNLGLITEGRHKTFCIVSNKKGWRNLEPGHWAGDETSNRFEQLVLRALAEELITASKAAGLLRITLSELAKKFDWVG